MTIEVTFDQLKDANTFAPLEFYALKGNGKLDAAASAARGVVAKLVEPVDEADFLAWAAGISRVVIRVEHIS